jgi:hypothetical protein
VAVAGASPASRAAETELRPAFLRTLVARSGALLDPLIASTHPADLPVAPTYSENTHLDDRIKRFFPDIYLFTGKTGKARETPTNDHNSRHQRITHAGSCCNPLARGVRATL